MYNLYQLEKEVEKANWLELNNGLFKLVRENCQTKPGAPSCKFRQLQEQPLLM